MRRLYMILMAIACVVNAEVEAQTAVQPVGAPSVASKPASASAKSVETNSAAPTSAKSSASSTTADNSRPVWSLRIQAVSVDGVRTATERPLKDLGVQQTKLDTLQLHENIALSMSDVLTQRSTIFIKSFGRATLSTASFRGTSASHTQVTWNGMKINSPMLGMTDFSMIPSYFVDDATLYHGTSSVAVSGGGLGGAVSLQTKPTQTEGFALQYVQGVGSFKTFDEFLRLNYGGRKWQASTRVVYSSSPNEYRYRNYMKRVNIYDDNKNIVGTYYPTERNQSGDFHDLHVLQELYYNRGDGNRFGVVAWFVDSKRGVPRLNVDYRDQNSYVNRQCEQTLRGIVTWERIVRRLKLGAKGGYIHTTQRYDFSRDVGSGTWVDMVRSRSKINTVYGQFEAEYYLGEKMIFTGNVALHQHFVDSRDKNVITQQGDERVVGYDMSRIEFSSYLAFKWRPTQRLGLSASLREDMYGGDWTPVIPALFADYVLSKRGNVVLKGSVSRNYRYPTLNDQYFLPGGNPDLRPERGVSYDVGAMFDVGSKEQWSLKGELTAFDSYIDNWIIWLPSFKGFWEPRNIRQVHAYGAEVKLNFAAQIASEWYLRVDANGAYTPSINRGDAVSSGDEAFGKQLPYVPRGSASVAATLSWRKWAVTYKWCYYSRRYTMSSNDETVSGRLTPYFMSDVMLERSFSLPWAEMSLKGQVNNLLNEEYESVLSRPMPRMNFEIFFEIRPKFGRGSRR